MVQFLGVQELLSKKGPAEVSFRRTGSVDAVGGHCYFRDRYFFDLHKKLTSYCATAIRHCLPENGGDHEIHHTTHGYSERRICGLVLSSRLCSLSACADRSWKCRSHNKGWFDVGCTRCGCWLH